MNTNVNDPPAKRDSAMDWLVRVNGQLSSWAASVSWGRLIVLFLVILIAGGILNDQLNLQHDKVRIRQDKEDIELTIFGPDGIRIRQRATVPARSASDAAPAAQGGASGAASDSAIDKDDDDDEPVVRPRTRTQTIFTFRGLLGDLGAVLLTILFAYLAAAKIIVRKVAQADAKVRNAVDAAEQETMERQLVQARLQVLQAQVEPHFLFNTLSAIDYLIETDPPRASQMQKALITYLRGALPQMRQESSTLGRELRLIRSFLDLLKMRMEDRLEVDFAVPEGAESAEFPPMMLQSLVENAIKHGIEPKPEGGKVTVAARIQNGQLWVEVRDTGVGMVDCGEKLDAPTSGSGIGLQNIRERLAMLYPGKGRLTLISDENTGTVVRIGVPYQVGNEPAAGMTDARPAGSAA